MTNFLIIVPNWVSSKDKQAKMIKTDKIMLFINVKVISSIINHPKNQSLSLKNQFQKLNHNLNL